MNPHEEIPPEVADRAYFRQPVWKRIVVIAAGPAMNILIAFLILWAVFLANGTNTITERVGKVDPAGPPQGSWSPATRSSRSTAIAAISPRSRARIASHRCAGRP